MDIAELKQEYNGLLKRFEAGSEYLDDDSIPIAERESRIPAFIKILERLNRILYDLKECGLFVTDNEILGGMRIE